MMFSEHAHLLLQSYVVQCSFLHTSNFKGNLSSKIQSFIDELAVFPIGSDAEIAGDHIVL